MKAGCYGYAMSPSHECRELYRALGCDPYWESTVPDRASPSFSRMQVEHHQKLKPIAVERIGGESECRMAGRMADIDRKVKTPVNH